MTLSRNLADALCQDGVRINHMNVGWVLTPNENALKISEGMPPDWADHPPRGFAPSGKLIRPEEVATLAVYWIGDESRPVSGTVMEFERSPSSAGIRRKSPSKLCYCAVQPPSTRRQVPLTSLLASEAR